MEMGRLLIGVCYPPSQSPTTTAAKTTQPAFPGARSSPSWSLRGCASSGGGWEDLTNLNFSLLAL
jgi:hypothetical protein